MSTLTLTQGTGVTLRKSGTNLFIDAEGGGGGTGTSNCYVHYFVDNAGDGNIQITTEQYNAIFSEAEMQNSVIILKIFTPGGAGEATNQSVYVLDGVYTSPDGNYTEIGFNNEYIYYANNKAHSKSREYKLGRTRNAATSTYDYSCFYLDPPTDTTPMAYYSMGLDSSDQPQNTPSNPNDYKVILAAKITGSKSGGGSSMEWFYMTSSSYTNPVTSGGTKTYTVTYKSTTGTKTLTATRTGETGDWTWTLA